MIANRAVTLPPRQQLRNFDVFDVALNRVALRTRHEHPDQAAAVRHEAMRIAGKRVETDQQIEVLNPYNGAVVGTVPAARPEHVREAFAKAKAFKPKLTRYERQQILLQDRRPARARARRSSPASSRRSPGCAGRTRSTRRAAPTTSIRSPASSPSRTTARPMRAISLRRASSARSSPRAFRSTA